MGFDIAAEDSSLCSPPTANDDPQKQIMMKLTKTLFGVDLNPQKTLREMCEHFRNLSDRDPNLVFEEVDLDKIKQIRVNDMNQILKQKVYGFNPAIQAFDKEVLDVVARAMQDARGAADFSRHTLVSVGSGNGCVEEVLKTQTVDRFPQYFKGWEIIGIDPDPTSYAITEKCHIPTFPSIKEYREEYKRVGADAMLINWPDPDNSGYDFDAIMDLLPSQLVLIYTLDETSGSKKLRFLFNQQPETFGYELVENHAIRAIVDSENDEDKHDRKVFEEQRGWKHDPDRYAQKVVYRLQRYKRIN